MNHTHIASIKPKNWKKFIFYLLQNASLLQYSQHLWPSPSVCPTAPECQVPDPSLILLHRLLQEVKH